MHLENLAGIALSFFQKLAYLKIFVPYQQLSEIGSTEGGFQFLVDFLQCGRSATRYFHFGRRSRWLGILAHWLCGRRLLFRTLRRWIDLSLRLLRTADAAFSDSRKRVLGLALLGC
ncbi:MAG: hypothetical protein ACK44Z_04130 [Pirellulaceae bacterium]